MDHDQLLSGEALMNSLVMGALRNFSSDLMGLGT
jgi:hypothetical protein